jgi:hypothetical protein
LIGGFGHDLLDGGSGNDVLGGALGAGDTLLGGGGNDTLVGSFSGADLENGGSGNDFLILTNADGLNLGAVYEGGTGTNTLFLADGFMGSGGVLISPPFPITLSGTFRSSNWATTPTRATGRYPIFIFGWINRASEKTQSKH